MKKLNPAKNYEKTKKQVGYVPRKDATRETYTKLGFKCGHEVHQQLKTEKKLFCRCPAGIYQGPEDHDAEIVRHMRPTLSELGEYDGTALMEFKTKKNIFYRLKNNNACTYEMDDTPPFPVNRDALDIAIEIGLLLKGYIVGELHITRKQYLDGSIPTGFQRTAIVSIEGEIPLSNKKVRIIQLSIEEDSCREVSDIGHDRVYRTDRLGMPLIETVTYPDMLTPDEAEEGAQYIRFLNRSTGKVNTGIGATRQDVNVSITGGTRVEIKGVAHIRWIPDLTHIEAFRQRALLDIKDILQQRVKDPSQWKINSIITAPDIVTSNALPIDKKKIAEYKIAAVNLPEFKGLLSYFTQPGKSFSDELSDRLKVIACLEKPNMFHSEDLNLKIPKRKIDFDALKELLNSGENDAQIVLWGPEADIAMALETIEERCLLAFEGVPNETRKSFKDGTTIFERVLPGPDRMYPDTDSMPLSIAEEKIETIRKGLPMIVADCMKQMTEWKIPADTFCYILKRNLFPLLKQIVVDFKLSPIFVGTFIGHQLKHIEGQIKPSSPFDYKRIYELFEFLQHNKLQKEILTRMLPEVYHYPNMDFKSILENTGFRSVPQKDIVGNIPLLKEKFKEISHKKAKRKRDTDKDAITLWVMGQLRPIAEGNMDLIQLRNKVEGGK
ncbi:MAG: Glu-tRNA(Gln) amidotransferase subunit GatE [bacterium]|nr:Glu-tRNA(Gln) amidotransferase subunit GatE [bacterium]